MPTVSDHAASIVAIANEIDPLVAQLRDLMRNITVAEQALYHEADDNGPYGADTIAGRRRLAVQAASLVADAMMPDPATPRPTTAELAQAAWQEFLA